MKCDNCGIRLPDKPEDAIHCKLLCDRCHSEVEAFRQFWLEIFGQDILEVIMDEKLLETLHQYFPIAWEIKQVTKLDASVVSMAVGESANKRFCVIAQRIIHLDYPELETWMVQIKHQCGVAWMDTMAESDRTLGTSLPDALSQVKQQWERLGGDMRSLIILEKVHPQHFPNVTTECGDYWWFESKPWTDPDFVPRDGKTEYKKYETGYWTDGDFVQPHCPTDGFFMGQDGQVVQLKATEQYANGKYWLGEIKVDADDMRSLNFIEMDGYPGYVGMPPAPRQTFEVESDVEDAIAQIQDLHPGQRVMRFPWCLSSILHTVYVYVQDDLDDGKAIVYQIDRRSPKLL